MQEWVAICTSKHMAGGGALTPDLDLLISANGACAALLLLSCAERRDRPGDLAGALLFKKLSCPTFSHEYACRIFDRHVMGTQLGNICSGTHDAM